VSHFQAEALRLFIEMVRNRTTNTIEQWNLMLAAERALEREAE
jgi:hypothetical protein